jgi:CheY-like chemotaxis protein
VKRRIVFVDDDVHILNGFRRILELQRETWDMVFFTSADQVLQETKATKVDVIVSDVRMPGIDGFELLRLLKASERTRDIPVVIVTGNHEQDLKQRALDLGAADLLSKPVESEDLIARVQSALCHHSAKEGL